MLRGQSYEIDIFLELYKIIKNFLKNLFLIHLLMLKMHTENLS